MGGLHVNSFDSLFEVDVPYSLRVPKSAIIDLFATVLPRHLYVNEPTWRRIILFVMFAPCRLTMIANTTLNNMS